MAKTKAEKDLQPSPNTKRLKIGKKAADPDSNGGAALSPDEIQRLLEPYTKDQLVSFLLDAAASDPALLARIRAVADSDVSHRKVFVHGLSWDSTRENLTEAFAPFGEIEDCNVVVDKATGRAKGYGFVLFRSRASAAKALKQPQKTIKNRLTHSQLASVGPVGGPGGQGHGSSVDGRRIYVSNVHAEAAPEKLKSFFEKFGEIEVGPMGFDITTGKSRGFAVFIYKTMEGASRALQEPYKMFEGHQLHCQKATEKGKGIDVGAAAPPAAALLGAAAQQPVLAAMAAAQNLALLGQNPAYAALFGGNPLLTAAALNPFAAAALNPALNQATGYGGASSLLGSYGSQGPYGSQGSQLGQYGMPSYQDSQLGQSSSTRIGGSFGGFPSYM